MQTFCYGKVTYSVDSAKHPINNWSQQSCHLFLYLFFRVRSSKRYAKSAKKGNQLLHTVPHCHLNFSWRKKKSTFSTSLCDFFMEMNWYKYCKFLPAISQRFGKLKRKRERSQQHSISRHIKARWLKIRSMKTRKELTRGYIPKIVIVEETLFSRALTASLIKNNGSWRNTTTTSENVTSNFCTESFLDYSNSINLQSLH